MAKRHRYMVKRRRDIAKGYRYMVMGVPLFDNGADSRNN